MQIFFIQAGIFYITVGMFPVAVGKFPVAVGKFSTAVEMFSTAVEMFPIAVGKFSTAVEMIPIAVGKFSIAVEIISIKFMNLSINNQNIEIMNTKNYVPIREEDFFNWAFNLKTVMTGYGAEDYMPPATYHEFMRLGADYETKFAIAENHLTRTSKTINDRQEARAAYEKFIRDMVQTYLVKNPNLTDGQKIAAGIPVHKTTHTPAPVDNVPPGFRVKLPSPGVIEIDFFNAENNKVAKPFGQHSAKIRWAILDHPTEDWRELTNSATDTHTPYRLKFEGTDRGKTVYFALCWVNTREEEGDFSEIFSAIIP